MDWRNIPAPLWLLSDLGMAAGKFNEDGTMITGPYDAHNSAVLNVGHGPPGPRTVVLSDRPDWDQIRARLVIERSATSG